MGQPMVPRPITPIDGLLLLLQRERFRMDQDGGDYAGLLRSHAPGVVRAALDQDVAGLQQLLAGFHDRPDLALEDDDVVDRLRAMHHRVGRPAVLRVAGADRLEAGAAVGLLGARAVGRKLDDAHDAAVLRRLEVDRTAGGVCVAGVRGRRAFRFPEIGQRQAREGRRHLLDVRRRAVGDEGRPAFGIVAGQDPAHPPDHALTASLAAIFLRALTPLSGESLKSNSTLTLPLGQPTFLASASLIFLYLLTSESFTASPASLSPSASPS